MKILFKQTDTAGSLAKAGIRSCYFKMLLPERDKPLISKKAHHHSTFELHMITHGAQHYDVDGKECTITAGEYLLICPMVTHRFADTAAGTQKFSLSFSTEHILTIPFHHGTLSPRMSADLSFATGEAAQKKQFSPLLLENIAAELIITVLRDAGMKECHAPKEETENATLLLAKKYIEDNITRAPTVAAVAAYCHLSPKQLTRIFERFEGTTPAHYITAARIARIEQLLSESNLSLSEISEYMYFSSEYYLNSFFKKHAGLPPGQYRKMKGK